MLVVTKGTNYTSGPKLISAATPQKPTAATTAAVHVVATTPVKTREANIIDGSLFCGGWVINSRRRLQPYYCARKVTLASPDGGTTEMYLAQGSNDATQFKPILLPAYIMGNAIVPVRGNAVKTIAAKLLPGAGSVYKTADIAEKCPDVVSTNPFANKQDEHRIVVIPASMPMLASEEGGYRGKLDEAAFDALDLNIPGTSAWLRLAQDFDQDFHLAVASVVNDKKSKLGKAWPKNLTKAHTVWVDDLFIDPVAVDDDAAEELEEELAALQAHVESIRGPLEVPTSIISSEPRDDVSAVTGITRLPAPPAALPSDPVTPAGKSSTPFKIPKRASLAQYDEHDVNYAKFCMIGAGFDPADNSITVGTVTAAMESVFTMPGGKATKLASFRQILENGSDALSTSTDFLLRRADPPDYDPATLALLFNNIMEHIPMTDLAAASSSKRMRLIYFAPDNKHITAQREAVTDDRQMEEICGEEATNYSKVRTAILFNHQVLSMEVFLIWLGNIIMYLVTAYKVDTEHPDKRTNPLLYRCYNEVALCLTSKPARKYFKHLPSNVTMPKILSWWAQICDQLFILITAPVGLPSTIINLLGGKYDKLDVSKYREASAVLREAKTKWNRIVSLVDTVPDSSIYASYEAAKKRKPDGSGDADKEAKKARQAVEKDRTAATKADKDKLLKKGIIVYKMPGAMPIVEEADPKKRICAAHHREGVICSRKNCPLVHELDPTKWDAAVLKKWNELIESTDGMSWHSSVDAAKLRSILSSSA